MNHHDTITSDELISDARLREIADGCAGVTPGPWEAAGSIYEHMGAEVRAKRGLAQLWKSKRVALDAAHIARLDPATVRSIVTELIELRARLSADKARMASAVEQAFRDGLAYGRNVTLSRPEEHDLAWFHSRARAALQNASTTP